jgi:hopanoid biosynthesis associated radical SAM protein HpnH
MRFPLSLTAGMAGYIARNKLWPRPAWQVNAAAPADPANPFRIVYSRGASRAARRPHPLIGKRFPLVLMLEPLHTCNLTCTGCGRIREYESTIAERLSLDQCLKAAEECGAPIVSICGGEPLLYPEVGPLTAALLARGRHVYLCTNGMMIRKRLAEFRPHPRLFLNVHLDGMERTHDAAVERAGVFREAVEGIRAAKRAGFVVCTNTTVYRETRMEEIRELFTFLRELHVDGHMIAPAYGYSAVDDREIFMTRDDVHEKFKGIDALQREFPLHNSPVYFDFLKGERDLPCTAWGNPTYNVAGWKGPCYLITDAHYRTFEELMTRTPWDNYGRHGDDLRCEHCMMHCGFEPSAALGINARFGDSIRLLTWALR